MTWIPLTKLIDINNFDLIKNETSESNKFLKYSIDTVLECQNAALQEDSFYIRSVDLVITEKCTLKCKDCANLMQFYNHPVNYDQQKVIEGIIELASKTKFIHEVRIIGGEPFLNKEIYSIIKMVSIIPNINNVIIYTNGMIPPKEEELKFLNKEKVLFSITDYAELGKNLDKTISILQKNNFSFRLHPPEHWTDSGRILARNDDINYAKELFAKCCGKNLFTLIDDKLYRCPFAANADNLNAIPINKSNSVKVLDTIKNIRDFAYKINYMEACMYCPGRSFDAPEIIPALQTKKPIEYKRFIPIKPLLV
jgi:organic radical activating enzyme